MDSQFFLQVLSGGDYVTASAYLTAVDLIHRQTHMHLSGYMITKPILGREGGRNPSCICNPPSPLFLRLFFASPPYFSFQPAPRCHGVALHDWSPSVRSTLPRCTNPLPIRRTVLLWSRLCYWLVVGGGRFAEGQLTASFCNTKRPKAREKEKKRLPSAGAYSTSAHISPYQPIFASVWCLCVSLFSLSFPLNLRSGLDLDRLHGRYKLNVALSATACRPPCPCFFFFSNRIRRLSLPTFALLFTVFR